MKPIVRDLSGCAGVQDRGIVGDKFDDVVFRILKHDRAPSDPREGGVGDRDASFSKQTFREIQSFQLDPEGEMMQLVPVRSNPRQAWPEALERQRLEKSASAWARPATSGESLKKAMSSPNRFQNGSASVSA